ncbi:hypothetical protein KKD70_00520 [Patescibacteria group bacterium]|nr:hypothetical protein [Patescibacteria group bacterium]
MSKKDDLQSAISLLQQGKRKEAAAQLLSLEAKITDKGLRIQLIDLLLSALDPVDECERLIILSSEGAKIANDYGRKDYQAHFMSRKAEFLMTKISFLQYRQSNLKLSPEWFEFSTEADKNEFNELTAKIDLIEKEIEELLQESLQLAEESGNKTALGRVLMERASIESSRYLHYKAKFLHNNFRAKLWLKFDFLRNPFFEQLIIYPRKHAKRLQSFINAFTSNFLRAAKIFEELDDPTAGYAYHNLAIHLKSSYAFRAAKKYFRKAKKIAEKYDDPLLKSKVNELEISINAKNQDIPDYVNGEKRPRNE